MARSDAGHYSSKGWSIFGQKLAELKYTSF